MAKLLLISSFILRTRPDLFTPDQDQDLLLLAYAVGHDVSRHVLQLLQMLLSMIYQNQSQSMQLYKLLILLWM